MMLQIHDASFPAVAGADVGRGTPYGEAGAEFAGFARSLGFTGLQFGPQGQTGRGNPSPYDSTAFSRNFLSISFTALQNDPRFGRLVDEALLEATTARAGGGSQLRTRHEVAYDAQLELCVRAHSRYREAVAAGVLNPEPVELFVAENRYWLEPDAIFETLTAIHATREWRAWPDRVDRRLFCPPAEDAAAAERRRVEILRDYGESIDRYMLIQFLAHYQHQVFHELARATGLALYADLQVGLSLRDVWRLQPLFLPGNRLGAPPSRTNAEGQPWGYSILDPERYFEDGDVGTGVGYLGARAEKLFTEFDGVRIDHPQGLVCPWIYRTDDPDPVHAVQNGARLFSSPNLSDHSDLARYALVAAEQLSRDAGVARHADSWVRELSPEQVDRYARLFSVIMDAAARHRLEPRSIACETLSTQPYPLKRVMERFGLGRFRVTQKMNVGNPADVYRTDNAVAPDWVMLGNHDTRPIWARVAEWEAAGELGDRASYLARRLAQPGEADEMRRGLTSNTGMMVQAMFADMLLSKAENVAVFFADLLGMRETYNAPGTVGPENWSLRVPPDYRGRYEADASECRALNIPYACSLALKSPLAGGESALLVKELEKERPC